MTTPPYENTLTTNSTHQQLMELGPRISGTVTSPARIEEADKGHDIEYNTAKRVAYQYKRMDPKGPIERNIDRNPNEEWIKFGDDHTSDQVKTLLSNTFTLDTAFLTLPVIEYDAHLPEILDRTVFVDVFGLMIAAIRSPHSINNFKTLYVSRDGLKSTKTKNKTPAVFWKHTDTNYLNSHAYHRVPSGVVRDWSEIQRRLVDCPLGMRTWESGEKTEIFEEYREYMKHLLRVVDDSNDDNLTPRDLVNELVELRRKHMNTERFREYLSDDIDLQGIHFEDELKETLSSELTSKKIRKKSLVDFHYKL